MDQVDRKAFLRQLVESPEGQAHLLTVAVVAEEGDELGIFDMVAGLVAEPRLARLVRRHQDDETRHAQLFRGCLDRLGLGMRPLPDELRLIRQLVNHLDGFQLGVHSPTALAGTYALLYAIEERGVEQFPLIAEAFRAVDPETADAYLAVTKDERRHLKYCTAVGRHFSPDEPTWLRTVDAARRVESAAFAAVTQADLTYTTTQGLVPAAAA
ncbi:MAG TPA: ferritin-like domain-containing protein [Acidimicrobiales bacterium]|jgi:rubrerythrin